MKIIIDFPVEVKSMGEERNISETTGRLDNCKIIAGLPEGSPAGVLGLRLPVRYYSAASCLLM